MGFRLRRHPFAVSAHFRHSLVLAYALPASALEQWLPPLLEPDRHGDLGFAAAAFVQTERMRPSPFPRALGLDFFLGGYRIFVRVADRPSLRGLYILRSDTDRRLLTFLGNLFTSYRYPHGRCRVPAGRLLSVRGTRSTWDPQPVAVEVRELDFVSADMFGAEPVLANAFYVSDVDYRWERGRLV